MKKLVVFSGAGLSAESGIPTFRDLGGFMGKSSDRRCCCTNWLDEKSRFGVKILCPIDPNPAYSVVEGTSEKMPEVEQLIAQA